MCVEGFPMVGSRTLGFWGTDKLFLKLRSGSPAAF
uniref:Uncharacterized protein n=1 Tax=Arundo donax TaxID=35708 RepID=A0A0A9HQN4_ARUDO